MQDKELENALNEGNGIALITVYVKCPNCREDIWISVGHHCGYDALLEGNVETECYKCLKNISVDTSDMSVFKNTKFMTHEQLHNITWKLVYAAIEALRFYEDCVDHIAYCEVYGKEMGFDWNRCRAYCSVGKSYSHSRFMAYVADFFGTSVKEMRLQLRNVK
jgi:hypothetical protein